MLQNGHQYAGGGVVERRGLGVGVGSGAHDHRQQVVAEHLDDESVRGGRQVGHGTGHQTGQVLQLVLFEERHDAHQAADQRLAEH